MWACAARDGLDGFADLEGWREGESIRITLALFNIILFSRTYLSNVHCCFVITDCAIYLCLPELEECATSSLPKNGYQFIGTKTFFCLLFFIFLSFLNIRHRRAIDRGQQFTLW